MTLHRCAKCGAEHDLADLEPSFTFPDAYLDVPEPERKFRTFVGPDDCRIRDAADTVRRYFLRALWRFAGLVAADLASFYVMRELVRAVREHAALGSWISDQVSELLPAGILNGWQYAAALFLSLILLGNYGRGDARRNAKRLFVACAFATALPLWMTLWTRGVEVVAQYALTTALVWLGLVVTVAGLVVYGAVFSRTASGLTHLTGSGNFDRWFAKRIHLLLALAQGFDFAVVN